MSAGQMLMCFYVFSSGADDRMDDRPFSRRKKHALVIADVSFDCPIKTHSTIFKSELLERDRGKTISIRDAITYL